MYYYIWLVRLLAFINWFSVDACHSILAISFPSYQNWHTENVWHGWVPRTEQAMTTVPNHLIAFYCSFSSLGIWYDQPYFYLFFLLYGFINFRFLFDTFWPSLQYQVSALLWTASIWTRYSMMNNITCPQTSTIRRVYWLWNPWVTSHWVFPIYS